MLFNSNNIHGYETFNEKFLISNRNLTLKLEILERTEVLQPIYFVDIHFERNKNTEVMNQKTRMLMKRREIFPVENSFKNFDESKP